MKAGRRDNPPRGIYNPYQINIHACLDIKQAFSYLVSRQPVSLFFFNYYFRWQSNALHLLANKINQSINDLTNNQKKKLT